MCITHIDLYNVQIHVYKNNFKASDKCHGLSNECKNIQHE